MFSKLSLCLSNENEFCAGSDLQKAKDPLDTAVDDFVRPPKVGRYIVIAPPTSQEAIGWAKNSDSFPITLHLLPFLRSLNVSSLDTFMELFVELYVVPI